VSAPLTGGRGAETMRRMNELHRLWPALAFPLAAVVTGCQDGPIVPAQASPIEVVTTPGCNVLTTSESCLLPFPSRWNEAPDPATPTGVRWNLDAMDLPLRNGDGPLDVAYFNAADGASPVVPILAHFGFDVDLSSAPGQDTLDSSIDGDPAIAIFDMNTGKRVRFFAEMDANVEDGYDGRYALILRPVEPMEMGSRIAVVMRDDLKKKDGTDIEPSAAFAALRDGQATTNEEIEAVRPAYEEIFAFLGEHGYPRERAVMAWDFHVASEEYLLGSVLSMRQKVFEIVAEGQLEYKLTKVADAPNENTLRIVEGDFEVPTFLRGDDTFEYDSQHHPVLQSQNRMYPFTMVIPKKAADGPLPLVVIGHGIFGEGRAFLTGDGDGQALQKLAQDFGAVLVATDWIGLSSPDLNQIANEVTQNLDRVGIVTDKLQQSLMNNLAMTKMVKAQISQDPAVMVGGQPLLDGRVLYWGASLGGIQGSGFIALSDEIERAVFGVPGSAWGTMLSRSIVFTPIKLIMKPSYPDPLDIQVLISLFQSRFDNTDPANITRLMFKAPLPDAPAGRQVILQEAIGDSQVPNIATELLARALGVQLLTPSFYPVSGLTETASPANGSVLAQYRLADYDKPLPPFENLAPASDNDVHHSMNFLPNAHLQIAQLFLQGEVVQYCEGTCDPD
jgi:hypothetical protein